MIRWSNAFKVNSPQGPGWGYLGSNGEGLDGPGRMSIGSKVEGYHGIEWVVYHLDSPRYRVFKVQGVGV